MAAEQAGSTNNGGGDGVQVDVAGARLLACGGQTRRGENAGSRSRSGGAVARRLGKIIQWMRPTWMTWSLLKESLRDREQELSLLVDMVPALSRARRQKASRPSLTGA